jgi:hypothetical protein
VGKEQAFEFNLADACKLTLRAIDVDTGKGIPGVSFLMESPCYELGGAAISGDNIGARHRKQRDDLTDKDGYLIRYMGPWEGYYYLVYPAPKGYEPVDNSDVTISTGKAAAEHISKFKKK